MVAKARCSTHRTGMAGHAPGTSSEAALDATDDASRVCRVRSLVYGWLVANADQLGFIPYLYELWHWEFAG